MVTACDLTLIVKCDWDKDGSFATSGDDISADVITVDVQRGITQPLDPRNRVAAVGKCTITLNNLSKTYSPGNTGGSLYGKLLPNVPVQVQITDGVTTWDKFTGFIETIKPDAGSKGTRRCVITCVDRMALYQRHLLSMFLQESVKAPNLLDLIDAAVFDGVARSIQLSFLANPSNNSYFEFTYVDTGGTTNTRRYTFKSSISTAGDVLIGADKDATAVNFRAAVNGDTGVGTLYGNSTQRGKWLVAEDGGSTVNAGGTLTVTASGATRTLDASQSFQVAASGLLSQITVELGAGAGSGDIAWYVVPRDPSLTWSTTPGENGYLDPSLYSTGTFTPTPSSTNTINVTGGIFLRAGVTYWLILEGDPTYTWQRSTTDVYANGHLYSGGLGSASSIVPFVSAQFTITTSAVTSTDVDLIAAARGAWSNSISIDYTGAAALNWFNNPAGSDATLSTDYDAGRVTFDYAGDRWRGDDNALSAIEDITLSEWGFFVILADGTVTFLDRDWWFKLFLATPALTISDEQAMLDSGVSIDGVYTEVIVNYVPRGETVSGTIVRARGPIEVPGQWGTARWTGARLPIVNPGGGSTITKIPAVDDSGNMLGVNNLDLPPIAGTNFTVSENRDGSGFDYTYKNHIGISVVINGGDVECSFTNDAYGPLYVQNFYLEGVGLIAYNPQQVIFADEDAVADYGRITLGVFLPLPATYTFANDLALYLLNTRKAPQNRLARMVLLANRVVGGVNVNSLDIGDVISVTETQTGLSGHKAVVMGINAYHTKGGRQQVTLDLIDLEATTYAIFDECLFDEAYFAL